VASVHIWLRLVAIVGAFARQAIRGGQAVVAALDRSGLSRALPLMTDWHSNVVQSASLKRGKRVCHSLAVPVQNPACAWVRQSTGVQSTG
jgi:hypothetical protein